MGLLYSRWKKTLHCKFHKRMQPKIKKAHLLLLSSLPSQHQTKKLLERLSALLDNFNSRVGCRVPFVKRLLFINENDGLLSILQSFLNRSHITDILQETSELASCEAART